jgi:hypothetical protein
MHREVISSTLSNSEWLLGFFPNVSSVRVERWCLILGAYSAALSYLFGFLLRLMTFGDAQPYGESIGLPSSKLSSFCPLRGSVLREHVLPLSSIEVDAFLEMFTFRRIRNNCN